MYAICDLMYETVIHYLYREIRGHDLMLCGGGDTYIHRHRHLDNNTNKEVAVKEIVQCQ